jgi:hypothetical protein
MGAHSSKPSYNEAQVRYILDFIRLKETVVAYPFSNRFNQPFYDSLEKLSYAVMYDQTDVHAAAKVTEQAFAAWQNAMFGPGIYVPYNLSWFKSADEIFPALSHATMQPQLVVI